MKATELLERQHREVEGMLDTLEKGRGQKKEPEHVEQLATMITAHSMIEEEMFYPVAKRYRPDLVLDSYEEHHLIAYALKRLFAVDAESETFPAKMKALRELLLSHVQEEEQEILPAVAGGIGPEENESLGRQMEARYREIAAGGYEEAAAARRARRGHDGHARRTASKKTAARKKGAHAQKAA